MKLEFWHVYVLGPAYFVWPWKSSASYRTKRDVTPGSLSATDTCIVYIPDIDAVRKQKKAEYAKQYRLKRKLLLQQQASKDTYMIRYFHP
jgi:hypothetical protein